MSSELIRPHPSMVFPFVLLLISIALGPLAAPRWWQKHYPKVACSLAVVTLAYYLFGLGAYERVLHTGHDYLSFIILIGSLFVISGGIHIGVKGEATPHVNVVFLLAGAILANLFGTTGASMLLIRPWIRLNKYRITAHHIVFFIFIVSNVGGSLTPVGDPPLFLGYLKGVPFWWVARNGWTIWLVAIAYLLGVFYVLDAINYHQAPREVRQRLAEPPDTWRFEGLWNLTFLLVVLAAVFIKNPPFLREAVMLAAALASWFSTHEKVHEANHFDFHPLREVAVLFVGIFATMMPALDWLELQGRSLSNPTPAFFYWGSGLLSSFLDNAPTYLGFLSAALGTVVDPAITNDHARPGLGSLLDNAQFHRYVLAISVGSVFFGANTYIGNGPNFMVKAIADQQKVATPGFLGLIWKYSLPILGPMLILVWLVFFRA